MIVVRGKRCNALRLLHPTCYASLSPKKLSAEIKKLEKYMYEHARNLEFEEAAAIRDRLEEVKRLALGPV